MYNLIITEKKQTLVIVANVPKTNADFVLKYL
jgi:hypothetical protein